MHKKSFYKACYASAPSNVLKLLVRLFDKRVVEMRVVDKVLELDVVVVQVDVVVVDVDIEVVLVYSMYWRRVPSCCFR